METAKNWLVPVKESVNRAFGQREPWQIASITAASLLTLLWLRDICTDSDSIATKSRKTFFKWLRKIPAVRKKIEKEMAKISGDYQKEIIERLQGMECVAVLPRDGLDAEELLLEVRKHLALGHYAWREGRVSGAVYSLDPRLQSLTTEVYGLASYTNPLHSDVFPGINKMEGEVVKMTAALFHGGPDACGTMTTGGTESIMMACKAYRDRARDAGVAKPEMVVPATAHSAFDKAAQYLGIGVRSVPVHPDTHKVDLRAMRRAICSRTCMLVGSAPNFPYGTMDDIEEIAKLGEEYGIPVHVDACLGGFLIAFMPEAGYALPPFDFSLKGVTSISADTHKYGFAPKGSSVILYRHPSYLHYQYTVTTDWPGGVYGSPTVNGSRAGGVIAACWATMRYYGRDRYVEFTKKIVDTTRYIEKRLRSVDNIYIFGTPATSVIAIGSRRFDIFRLSAALNKHGWNLSTLQFPSGIHISVTLLHTAPGVADALIEDIAREVGIIMQDPGKPVEGKMAVYGVAQSITDRSLVGDIVKQFIDSNYYVPTNVATNFPQKQINNN